MTSLPHFAKIVFSVFILVLASSCGNHEGHGSQQADITENGVTFSKAWVRSAEPPMKTSAIYLDAIAMESDDVLVGVSSPLAEFVELHESKMVDGVAQMRKLENIALKQGSAVSLEPGGLHIMLINLKSEIKPGESYPVTLTFENAGEITLEVEAKAKKGGGNHHHNH